MVYLWFFKNSTSIYVIATQSLDSTSICFACKTPSRDRSIKLVLNTVFAPLTSEKSLSTWLVPGKTVAKPPQNC